MWRCVAVLLFAVVTWITLPTAAQEDFVAKAREAKARGEFDQAINLLEQGLATDADNTSAHYVLAWLYLKKDQQDKAVAAFWKVLELDPDSQEGQEAKAALQRLGAVAAPKPAPPAQVPRPATPAATAAEQKPRGGLPLVPVGGGVAVLAVVIVIVALIKRARRQPTAAAGPVADAERVVRAAPALPTAPAVKTAELAQASAGLRALAVEVRLVAASAFASPGPMFNEARKRILEEWFANFASNLEGAAEALETGRGMDGNPISVAEVAEGLNRMCDGYADDYGKAGQRLADICGADVRDQFRDVLARTRSLASDIYPTASAREVPPAADTDNDDALTQQAAGVLEGVTSSQTDTRSFRDYPLLLECSKQAVDNKIPAQNARRLVPRLEELLRSEPDFDLAYLWLATCRDSADDFGGAVQTLLEGIQKSKRKGHLCAMLAEICLRRERLEMSLRAAIRAVELGTDLYIAHHIVAQLLEHYGKPQAAQRVLSGVPTELESWLVEQIQGLARRQSSEVTRRVIEEFASKSAG